MIKELTGLSDDDLLSSLMFNIRFQYALYTTSCIEQPLSDRTLGRFRVRCNAYERKTGIDLLHEMIQSLLNEMAEIMKIDLSLKRMDSFMVESNIKTMVRLELLYTCVANLAKEFSKAERRLLEGLQHNINANDRNQILYHNHSDETADKISTVLSDAVTLKTLCGSDFDESSSYQLLLRVLKEQSVEMEDGSYRLRTKKDGGMNGCILQNPSDPDATYREKAGKQHRGYVANITEASGEEGSIVTNYQYEQNTYSDSQFIKDALEETSKQDTPATVITDGAYAS